MRRALTAAAAAGAACLAGCGSGGRTLAPASTATVATPLNLKPLAGAAAAGWAAYRASPHRPPPSYAIGTLTLKLVDPTRKIGGAPRSFETIVRYPKAVGGGQSPGPFPLVVFGHGFNVTPDPYSPLLDAWTKAGYVVAAPVFPLENANAPGGPNEKDLPNQPADLSLVISSVSQASQSGSGRLDGLIDPTRIAVTGQSDGGDTALAAAYDPGQRDSRIDAAMILSGAEDPFAPQFTMPRSGPPLLAVQGTADTINPPGMTYAFYNQAAAPKFLLRLNGAGHQPPYTEPGPELTAVARTTIAFLDSTLKRQPGPLRRLLAAGTAGDDSQLTGSR
jgi:fermentation-respiration switch protein FrsA (DUF1100 family)